MIDADVFITNPSTLKELVSKGLSIAAPMLVSDGLYSNFWLATFCQANAWQSMCSVLQGAILML